MRFTLKQLRYLHTAGRVGSIGQASQTLNISQSSITGALDAIEQELNLTIFKRIPSAGLQPTAVGREVLRKTARFLAEADNFSSELAATGSGKSGTFHLALYRPSAPIVINSVLQRFTERYGHAQIKITEGELDTLLDLLDNADVDAVFPFRRVDRKDHGFMPLFEARPYAALPLDSPLSQQADVSLSELVSLPMILLDLPVARDRYLDLFLQRGLEPDVRHTVQTSYVACALVSAGLGFSILNLSDPTSAEEDQSYRAVPIRDEVHVPVYGVAYPAGVTPSKISQQFFEVVEELAHENAFEALTVSKKTKNSLIKHKKHIL